MPTLDPNSITLGLNIMFYVFLSGTVIFAFVGAIKGVWKTVISLVVQAFLLLIVALISPGVATLVGNIDLSRLLGEQTVPIFGTPVQVGSIRGMVSEYITATGFVSPVTGQSIYEVAMALTNILLSFFVFVVLALIFGLFGWVLSTLIYHTIVKWFIPKRIRMGHKYHILGAVSGGVMGFFVSWLLVSPFSYALNTIRENRDTLVSAKKSLGSEGDQYIDYLLAASDSTMSSNWLFGMSAPVVNMSTTASVLGTKADLSTLTALMNGLGKGFAKGLDASTNSPLDYTLIVGDQAAVDLMLDTLIRNNLVVTAMPFLLDAAVAYVQTPDIIDLTRLDFHGVDYSNEISSIKGIYDQLFKAGFVTKSLTDKDYTIDLEHEEEYLQALEIFASDPLVANNLAVLGQESARIIQNLTGFEILNTESEAYRPGDGTIGIDWSQEIMTLGQSVFSFSSLLDIPLTYEGALTLKDKVWQAMSEPDKFNAIRSILNGSDGNPGLLDSFIFNDEILNMDQAINAIYAYYPVLNNFSDKTNVIDVFEGSKKAARKNELLTLVDMLPFVKTMADTTYVPENGSFVWDLTNTTVIEETRKLVEKAKNLTLLNNLIPDTVYRSLPYILNSTFGSTSIFGLNVGSFDFSSPDEVLDGMTQFLDAVPSLLRIYKVTRENSSFKDIVKNIDSADFKLVMDKFIDSSMLNPDKELLVNGQRELVQNDNINILVKGIFDQFKLNSYGVSYPSDLSQIQWKVLSDGVITHPEVERLVKLLEDFKASADFLVEDGTLNLNSLDGNSFKNLLSDMVASDLLGDSANDFLNKQLKPVWDGIVMEIRFNKTRKEWQEKDKNQLSSLDYIGELYDLVKPIWESADFDYTSVTKEYLNAVLTTLYNGKFLEGDGVSLSSFLGDIVEKSFDLTSLVGYDGKQLFANPDESNFAWVINDALAKEPFTVYKQGFVPEGKVNPTFDRLFLDQEGEISKISEAFFTLSSKQANVDDGNFSSDDLKSTLLALHPSKTLSKLIAPLLRRALNNVSSTQGELLSTYGIDLSLLDGDRFASLPEEEYRAELDKLVLLYSYAKEGALNDIMANLDDLNAPSLVQGKTRLQLLDGILSDIEAMKMTSSTRSGKDHSFRVNFYASLFENSKIVINNFQHTLNGLVFLDSPQSKDLMIARAKAKESAQGVVLSSFERAVFLNFLLHQKDYIANRDFAKLSSLDQIQLLKGAADNLLSFLI